ncbi:ribonuclease T, partial [Salmonella enterica subsp. enterica serovar Poona]
ETERTAEVVGDIVKRWKRLGGWALPLPTDK